MKTQLFFLKALKFSFVAAAIYVAAFSFGQNSNPHQSEAKAITGQNHMQAGLNLLQQAKDFELASRKQLLESNNLRKKLLQAPSPLTPNQTSNKRAMAQQVELLQQQGSLLRNQASARQADAVAQFSLGLRTLWPDSIQTSQYFSAATTTNPGNELITQAHNTRERSVHPGMEASAPNQQVSTNPAMSLQPTSLQLNSAANQSLAMDVDRSTFSLSREGYFFGHIESQSASVNANAIPINQIHSWHLVLSDLQGKAVEKADIQFIGHMPGHVHGLPTQPQVSETPTLGVYAVLGVKFQMQGWWVIDFEVKADGKHDVLRFNLVL